MTAGLQADTFIEATAIEKQKVSYSDMEMDYDSRELVSNTFLQIVNHLILLNNYRLMKLVEKLILILD